MANIVTNTEDFSHADWTPDTVSVDTDTHAGPSFAGPLAGDADTVEDASAAAQGNLFSANRTIPNDSSDWVTSLYVRKDTETARFPEVTYQMAEGGTPLFGGISLNTATGETANSPAGTAPEARGVEDIDSQWWRFWFRKANNGTGNTTLRMGVFPARASTLGGSAESSVQGSIVVFGANQTNNSTLQTYEPDPTYSFDVPRTIWQLPELVTPALVDLLAVVDDPSGTEVTKKVALTDFSPLTVSNVVVQIKTVGSGTYTPTTGMKKVLAIGVGGGGGGNGGINTDSAGGGGGGGGTVIRLMTAAQIGASKAYVVGAGGAATSAGTATTLDTAGALLNAGGGGAGTAGATFSVIGVTVAGGTGGTAANGDLNIPGQPGRRGVIFSGSDGGGGIGGRSAFGFGAAPGGTNVAGATGGAYGGGGSGGHASATADRAGGAGADGILYLLEFIG